MESTDEKSVAESLANLKALLDAQKADMLATGRQTFLNAAMLKQYEREVERFYDAFYESVKKLADRARKAK